MSESAPRVVSVAYWIWVLCAAAMVLLGLLALTTPSDAIREQLGDDTDSFLVLLRTVGIVSVLVGLVIGFLAAPVRAGNPRLRTVMVAVSSVFALVAIAMSVAGLIAPVLLLIPVLLMVAGILIFREGARGWFRHG